MKVLVVGLGSIGRRHCANLKRLEPDAVVTVWRQRAPRDAGHAVSAADRTVFSLDDALETAPQCAVIAGPAPSHVGTALALAAHGVHLFIEKPLSNQLDGVDELLDLCRARGLVLQVGYNLRFHEPLQRMRHVLQAGGIGRLMSIRAEVGQYLPDWRPHVDYRDSVSARGDLGGGVLLELSHELDYARWLAGEVADVTARVGRLSGLDIDVEDTAEIILTFVSGAIGSIHLDMTSRAAFRTCRVTGTEGTLVWDGLAHHVRQYSAQTSAWTDLCPATSVDPNDTYVAELRHWLGCVRDEITPDVTGEDGRRALQLALAAGRSSDQRQSVAV
jgi:predicted dehydrogenase